MAAPLIKFGTDGWRAIIAEDYTVDNVKRVAAGTALWLKENGGKQVVIGHDCRFGGKLFAETTARVMGKHGLRVILAPDFVSTPMVSLGVVKTGSDQGIVITASHNPPAYNGFKLKSALGGPTIPGDVAAVEALIPDAVPQELPSLEELQDRDLLEYQDLEKLYREHALANFDFELIRNSGIRVAYDPMFGAGRRVMQQLLPQAVHLHIDENPGFHGQAPEPIDRNLGELRELIQKDGTIGLGIANDGDADRIGLYDGDGNFVDSHHILLLLLLYQYEYRGLREGKVVITFSVTDKMKKLAEHYGLNYQVTPIGFKYIAEIMAEEDVLVGGEESGGLAVKGHIPERDGIWIGLLILEFMAKTGKSLRELIAEVYALVGPFDYDRDDVHVDNDKKWAIVERAKEDPYSAFGPYTVSDVKHTDGSKYYLGSEDRWLMIRPSGTEPVLRLYAQGDSPDEVRKILDAAREELGI